MLIPAYCNSAVRNRAGSQSTCLEAPLQLDADIIYIPPAIILTFHAGKLLSIHRREGLFSVTIFIDVYIYEPQVLQVERLTMKAILLTF